MFGTSSATAGGGALVVAGSTLPFTGVSLFVVSIVALALLLVGFLLFGIGRRRSGISH